MGDCSVKIEIGYNGWSETTTTKIKIEKFNKDPFKTSVSEFIKVNDKLGLKKGFRSHCSCCHTSWKLLNGKTNLLFTNKGNKMVCDECFDKLGGNS